MAFFLAIFSVNSREKSAFFFVCLTPTDLIDALRQWTGKHERHSTHRIKHRIKHKIKFQTVSSNFGVDYEVKKESSKLRITVLTVFVLSHSLSLHITYHLRLKIIYHKWDAKWRRKKKRRKSTEKITRNIKVSTGTFVNSEWKLVAHLMNIWKHYYVYTHTQIRAHTTEINGSSHNLCSLKFSN